MTDDDKREAAIWLKVLAEATSRTPEEQQIILDVADALDNERRSQYRKRSWWNEQSAVLMKDAQFASAYRYAAVADAAKLICDQEWAMAKVAIIKAVRMAGMGNAPR